MPFIIGQATDRWTSSSGHSNATRQLCRLSDCCAPRRPALRDPNQSSGCRTCQPLSGRLSAWSAYFARCRIQPDRADWGRLAVLNSDRRRLRPYLGAAPRLWRRHPSWTAGVPASAIAPDLNRQTHPVGFGRPPYLVIGFMGPVIQILNSSFWSSSRYFANLRIGGTTLCSS